MLARSRCPLRRREPEPRCQDLDALDLACPDLDALFGAESPKRVKVASFEPHPALLRAVEKEAISGVLSKARLAARDYHHANADCGSLIESITDDLDMAIAAMKRRDWAACCLDATSARTAALQRLEVQTDLQLHGPAQPTESLAVLKALLALSELLLALCSAAENDAVQAMQHADFAFLASPQGSARQTAVLFGQCLGEIAAAQQPPADESVRNATFGDKPIWMLSRRWPVQAENVRRLHDIDAPELCELAQLRSPFVVKDWMGQAWAARERWSKLSYLHKLAGHRVVPVDLLDESSDAGEHLVCRRKQMLLADFLQTFLVSSCWLCASSQEQPSFCQIASIDDHDLLEQCPELRADIPLPSKMWREALGRPKRTSVWLGTHDAETALQCHGHDVCLTQVHGVRCASLFPPQAAPDKHLCQAGVSEMNAQAQVVELRPGDVLFIPRGWRHQVRALSPACAVTSWF